MINQLALYCHLLRIRQWIKNILCLAGAFFTTGTFFSATHFLYAFITMIAFCFASSAVYILNDICDIKKDKLHPEKKKRPIASGEVNVTLASLISTCLIILSLLTAWQLQNIHVVFCITGYFICNFFYSMGLKNKPIIDIFCISFGFLLRLLAGVYVIGDKVSAWMFLCTLFITMFFGFSKRRSELASTGNKARPSLAGYSIEYLDLLVISTGVMAILSYAIFTITGGRDSSLVLTVFPVIYAVFHLVRIMQIKGGMEEAERIFFKDREIIFTGLLWFISFVLISHWSPQWFL